MIKVYPLDLSWNFPPKQNQEKSKKKIDKTFEDVLREIEQRGKLQ